jgi:rRNA maturation endonuclease Nob1
LLNNDRRDLLVLDTSAFIAGFNPQTIDSILYSVPAVKAELIPNSLPWIRFDTATENKKLRVRLPLKRSLERVIIISKHTGDYKFLSDADQQILALSAELFDSTNQLYIVTDDYSIQNVANQMKIKFSPLVTFGISYNFNWILYCPACHRKYPADHSAKYCDVCETELKRKPFRKKAL